MNKLTILGLALLIAGCASSGPKNEVSLAYASFQDGNYQNVLTLIVAAEKGRKLTDEVKAELAFLKAQTYHQMGQRAKAEGLYEYLKEEHPNSQYGYLASKMLEMDN